MGNHKKKVREEKSKTKLKGNKLLKGLNVTKTDFKVKRIVIREQLKNNNDDEIQSSRHLKVKECVTKLNHYNSTMRLDGLNNLKEIVVKHFNDIVKNHLNEIILSLLKLSVDIENNIRSEAYKLLLAIISVAPSTSIKPFYDIICSYTRCAMSHIKTKIQEDSLILLDIIIDHIPDLISVYFETIFQCFLDILSKQKQGLNHQRVMLSDVTRTDVISKWRVKIFERIFKMLLAYNSEIFTGTTKCYSNNNYHIFDTNYIFDQNLLYRKLNRKNQNHNNSINLNKLNYVPIIVHLNSNGYTPTRKNSIRKSMFYVKQLGTGHIDKDAFIQTIMSLLFDAWAEVKPNETAKSHLSQDAESTLNLVVLIMEHLWNVSVYWDEQNNSEDMMDLYRRNFFNEFSAKILNGFPFQSSDKPNKRTTSNVKQPSNCNTLNFTICSIYLVLLKEIRKNELENLKTVLGYVNDTLSEDTLKFTQTYVILKITKLILNQKNSNFLHNDTEIKTLVVNVVQKAAKHVRINDEILILLSEISLNDKFAKYFGGDMLNNFVRGLPDLLCQPRINIQTLTQHSKFGVQKHDVFLNEFLLKTDKILENLNTLEVSGINDQFEGKKLIMNMFYWLESSKKLEIERKVDVLIKDNQIKDYLKSVLKL